MRLSRRSFAFTAVTAPFFVSARSAARQATPAPGFEPASERMANLMQYVPGGNPEWELGLVWCDVERQVATIREQASTAAGDFTDTELALRALYSNVPNFFSHGMLIDEFAGYAMESIAQVIQFGSPLALTNLVHLHMSAEELFPFWESVGYEERENEYGRFWTIGEDASVDVTHPVQRRVLASFNNIAMLEDTVLAYASTADVLHQTMAAAAGEEPNRVAAFEEMSAGIPDDSTSIWHHNAEVFLTPSLITDPNLTANVLESIEQSLNESNEVAGSMPMLQAFSTGIAAGAMIDEDLHDPNTREFIILQTGAPNEAEQAAEVLAWRLENLNSLVTGNPYSELLPDAEIDVIDGQFLRLSISMSTPRAVFTNMIQRRDTLLFVYDR